MTQMKRKPSGDVDKVNEAVDKKLGYADTGKKLHAKDLRELIAEHIANTVSQQGLAIRDVPCPPPNEWGRRKGLLPEATRLRVLNPDLYTDAQAAIEGEFRRVQGDMLFPTATVSRLAALGIRYSAWFPPLERPTNTLISQLVVGRGNDSPDTFACCLVQPKTILNRLQIAAVIPGSIEVPKKPEVEAAGLELGKLCPFTMPEKVAFCIDRSVMALSRIAVNAGETDMMLVLPPDELRKLPQGINIVPGLTRFKETP